MNKKLKKWLKKHKAEKLWSIQPYPGKEIRWTAYMLDIGFIIAATKPLDGFDLLTSTPGLGGFVFDSQLKDAEDRLTATVGWED